MHSCRGFVIFDPVNKNERFVLHYPGHGGQSYKNCWQVSLERAESRFERNLPQVRVSWPPVAAVRAPRWCGFILRHLSASRPSVKGLPAKRRQARCVSSCISSLAPSPPTLPLPASASALVEMKDAEAALFQKQKLARPALPGFPVPDWSRCPALQAETRPRQAAVTEAKKRKLASVVSAFGGEVGFGAPPSGAAPPLQLRSVRATTGRKVGEGGAEAGPRAEAEAAPPVPTAVGLGGLLGGAYSEEDSGEEEAAGQSSKCEGREGKQVEQQGGAGTGHEQHERGGGALGVDKTQRAADEHDDEGRREERGASRHDDDRSMTASRS